MPATERDRSFDAEGFFGALDAVRSSRKLTWRKLAENAGVSASTLTRMSQGRRPDVDSFAALTRWASLDPDNYLVAGKGQTDSLEQISVLLRRDPKLSDDAAKAIDELIRATYERLKES